MAEDCGLDVDKGSDPRLLMFNKMTCATQHSLADLQLLELTENNSLSLTIQGQNSPA
jgi:hypothetical protein